MVGWLVDRLGAMVRVGIVFFDLRTTEVGVWLPRRLGGVATGVSRVIEQSPTVRFPDILAC